MERTRWAWTLSALLGLLALASEAQQAIGGTIAGAARVASSSGDPQRAAIIAARALRWTPYDTACLHIRLAALRDVGAWPQLAAEARAATPWDPDGAHLTRLTGEAYFQMGDFAQAASWLLSSLRRDPRPLPDALAEWRLAMDAGRHAWGDGDARVQAEAREMASLAQASDAFEKSERAAALRDAARTLQAADAAQAQTALRQAEALDQGNGK